jgi:hypothetical protein
MECYLIEHIDIFKAEKNRTRNKVEVLVSKHDEQKSLERYRHSLADNISKNFWEELIAYFHLIQHGPHRKRKNWGGDTHTDSKIKR